MEEGSNPGPLRKVDQLVSPVGFQAQVSPPGILGFGPIPVAAGRKAALLR
jgi:hypothetical protein